MRLLFACGLSVVVIVAVILVARLLDAKAWRRSLAVYSLRLPAGLTAEGLAGWLSSLAALTHAPRGALLPSPPVVVEVIAQRRGIEHRLLVPERLQGAVLASIRAALPGARIEELSSEQRQQDRLSPIKPITVAAELRLAGDQRQLAVERAETLSRSLLAALHPLNANESVRWQWIITGAGTPLPIKQPVAATSDSSLPWWLEGDAPADGDEIRAARLKQREPLLHVSGRVLVQAASTKRAYSIFGRVWGPVRLLNVPGSRLVRSLWPSWIVRSFVDTYRMPLVSWPLRLNSRELAGLLAFPLGDDALPGVGVAVARQVPPTGETPTSGTVLADSNYPGISQPLAISRLDRQMHVWLGGPTGVGKSTLMGSMILQDIRRGDGLAVIDPKGDLVEDLLARISPERRSDVIVIDPSDLDRPVGFNVLRVGGTESDRELAVDHVIHVLREQWRAYWGPRTESVLRSALLTLTAVRAKNGQAFTICETAELLTNARFRAWVIAQPTVPGSLRQYWAWFQGLSAAERSQVIGPVLNKLSALTTRTPLRLMLGQSQGLDLADAMRERKIILVPLSRGKLGAETAGLIGSLLVASLWQTALGRTALPPERRRPWFLHIDEAQEVVRLPLEVADMLAEARGLKVGIVMANQHLAQLPESVRHALLATVRSQVVFQVEPADARILARAFEPVLTERDLRSLPAYEVAMRLCVGGQTSRPVTGKTRPLPPATGSGAALRQSSRQRYGTERSAVETALEQRLGVATTERLLGKRPRTSGAAS